MRVRFTEPVINKRQRTCQLEFCAYLIDPTLFEVKRWPIRVETEGLERGKTWPAIPSSSDVSYQMPTPWRDRLPVNVCVGVDGARVVELKVSRLA